MEEESDPIVKRSIRISSHDVSVQLLARLDAQSYQQAVETDAKQINENYLIPLSFPYREGARLPKKAAKVMPRDIDELHAVTHCDGDLHAPFGDFNGPLGFGRFESGQTRGHYGVMPPAPPQVGAISVETSSIAVARRSEDPGVVDLAVQMPLPSSIDSMTPEDWRAHLIQGGIENAEALFHLPYNWNGKKSRTSKGPAKSYGSFLNSYYINMSEPAASSAVPTDKSSQVSFAKLNQRKSKSKQERDFSMACLRNWKVSSKVDGVSTRSSLFPSPAVIKDNSLDETKRKVIRPMLCNAVLPEEVQKGKTVSMEEVSKLDQAGLAEQLGSYDCRFMEKLLTQKKDSNVKTKRVEVGRIRLVWSNLIQGEEPHTQAARSPVVYNSLITGRRVDPSAIVRPRALKVGVRLRGKLIVEEAVEEAATTTTTNTKKRKHSTRSADSEVEKRQPIQVPDPRTDEEIEDAFACTLDGASFRSLPDKILLEKSIENGVMVIMNVNTKSYTLEQIDHRDIISSLMKFNKHKRSDGGQEFTPCHFIRGYAMPRFALLPFEDEHPRSVCISSGKMPSSSVHECLRDASHSDTTLNCSVCWSDEGAGQDGVQECLSCGLLAHRHCCLDIGQFLSVSSDHLMPFKIITGDHTNGISGATDVRTDTTSRAKWQCAVCSQYTEKTKRNARLPSRFTVDMVQDQSKQSSDSSMNGASKNVPGPRCSLCPHRGGAMSLLEPKSQQWVHEVCRIWSSADTPENKELENRPSHRNAKVATNVCALCGGTGIKKGKSNCMGLTKCAAPGCYVAFHPMCAVVASKMGISDEQGSVPSRKTRLSIEEEKKSEDDDEDVAADKKLCNEYTLQLVKMSHAEKAIPVAFCGLHNPGRDSSFYGRLPGGVMEQ